MAGGYLRGAARLGFPGDENYEKYRREDPTFTPNPLSSEIFGQLLTSLDPKVARTRTRRTMGRYADTLAQGQMGAQSRLNESYAARGLGGSGIAARAQGGLAQNQAYQRAQLPGLYEQALMQRQEQARSEALRFLLQILQAQSGQRQMHEGIKARKDSKPTGFQSVLGDISGISDLLGGLAKTGGGIAGLF